eukprot:TRINITY_DN234_c0_g1_i12.p1 TRINITY_DN234_c0_g1~~TRINITY_DN234_c0_g1_i12.p1  ORF type:complete len:841 (+),score=343.96 TRINITY_DN234_c0_g1_i12:716-3238(+)
MGGGVAVSPGGGLSASASEASSSPLVGMVPDSDASSLALPSPGSKLDSPDGPARHAPSPPASLSSLSCATTHAPVTLSWSDLTYTLTLPAAARRAAARAAAARDAAAATDGASGDLPPASGVGGGGGPDGSGADMDGLDAEEARAGVRHVLRGVSGRVASGQVLAIMGPSGCGKTTLLNLLAGRVAASRAHVAGGVVRVDGAARVPGAFRRLAAYVAQEDVLFSELTVREHIAFAAGLRVASAADVAPTTAGLLAELRLAHVAHVRVGSPLVRGVSGGERKRTAMAVELVAAPPLVFLDEPTSSLDAANALVVADRLAALAAGGRAVVTTIHQPRADIFDRFDLLLLLARGGSVAYYGPAAGVVTYFAGLSLPCPARVNPADWVIDLVSVRPPGGAGASGPSSLASLTAAAVPRRAGAADAAAAAAAEAAMAAAADLALILEAGSAQQLALAVNADGAASPTMATTEVTMSPTAAVVVDGDGVLSPGGGGGRWALAAVTRLLGSVAGGWAVKRRARPGVVAARAASSSPMVTQSRHRIRSAASDDVSAEEPAILVPWRRQFGTLLRRSVLLNVRERTFNRSRLVQALFVSSFVGVTFYMAGASRTGSLDDVVIVGNVLGMVIVSQLLTATTGLSLSFPAERAMMLRERANGSYDVSAYLLSKTLAESARNAVFSLLYSIIVYFLLGLQRSVANFGLFASTLLATSLMGESVALVTATAVSSVKAVAVLMPLMVSLPLLYSGILLPPSDAPVFLRWVFKVSYVSYAFAAVLKNQFNGLLFERLPFSFSAGVMTGEEALGVWQVNTLSVGACVGIVCAQAVALRLVAYAVLCRRGPRFDVSV